jgi:rhodanese-related sulfurtransferase
MATSGLLKPVTALDAKEAHDNEQIIIIDCRPVSLYLTSHITRSIFGVFDRSKPDQDPLTWVGLLI